MFTDWHKIDLEGQLEILSEKTSDNHMRSVSTTSFPPLPILLMIVTKIIVLIIIIIIMIVIMMMMIIIVTKTISQGI